MEERRKHFLKTDLFALAAFVLFAALLIRSLPYWVAGADERFLLWRTGSRPATGCSSTTGT